MNTNERKYKMWCNVCGGVIYTSDETKCPICGTEDIEDYENQDLYDGDVYDLFDCP